MSCALSPSRPPFLGGIGFALLSGKIYLNHVEYRTKNICVRVLQATVRVNWWFTAVRETETKHEGQRNDGTKGARA